MRFVHTADFHLGYVQKNLIGRGVLRTRTDDFFGNLERIVSFALERDVDAFFIAGDVFHTYRPQNDIFVRFVRVINPLLRAGIHVFVVAGNHDVPKVRSTVNPMEALNELSDRFHYLGSRGVIKVELKSGETLSVAAIPYIDPRIFRAEGKESTFPKTVEKVVRKLLASAPSADFSVLLAHLMLSESRVKDVFGYYAMDIPVTKDALHPDSFDYIALGHVHTPQKIARNVYYSGSIEKVSFKEAGEGKSFIYGEVTGSGLRVESVDLPCRKMVVVGPIDIDGVPNPVGTISEAISAAGGGKGSLAYVRIVSSRRRWREFVRRMPKLEEALLSGLGLTGYALSRQIKSEGSVEAGSAKRKSIEEIFEEYIRSRLGSERAKKLAVEIGKRMLRGELDAVEEA